MTDLNPISRSIHRPEDYESSATSYGAGAQSLQSVKPDGCYLSNELDSSETAPLSDGESSLVNRSDVRSAQLQSFIRNQVSDQSGGAGSEADSAGTVARNHAERTVQAQERGPVVEVGTNAAGDVDYAEAALARGRVRDGSGTVELASVYAQRGVQNEVGVTGLRVEAGDGNNYVASEAFEAEAHVGVYNSDGSRGLNAGMSATLVAGEVQLSDGANSASVGVALGLGAEASIGLRDANDDGLDELCARVALGPASVGACLETDRWLASLRRF